MIKIARFFYQRKLNAYHIQWILFDEFEDIEYLAKDSFEEVNKQLGLMVINTYFC